MSISYWEPDVTFLHDHNAFLTLRGLSRVMGDSVRITRPVTNDMLSVFFRCFDWSNPLHVCMHAAFLVAFFSFLRMSNLVPYTLADLVSDKSYFLKRSDVSFSASGAILRVYRTKAIQFNQRALEIPLPLIPNSVLCPVSAFQTLLSIVPAPPSAPLFIFRRVPALSLFSLIILIVFSNHALAQQVSMRINCHLAVSGKEGPLLLLTVKRRLSLSKPKATGKAMLI